MSKRLPPDMRERTCATNLKRPYLTRAIALMHASRFQKRHGGTRLNPYKCPGCRMWHLTSQEAKRG